MSTHAALGRATARARGPGRDSGSGTGRAVTCPCGDLPGPRSLQRSRSRGYGRPATPVRSAREPRPETRGECAPSVHGGRAGTRDCRAHRQGRRPRPVAASGMHGVRPAPLRQVQCVPVAAHARAATSARVHAAAESPIRVRFAASPGSRGAGRGARMRRVGFSVGGSRR